jgi:enoyl-CoA hydratase
VLQGAGRDFCAGYDLAGTYAGYAAQDVDGQSVKYRSVNKTLDDDAWQLEQTQRKTLTMFQIHKPIIAKVQGNFLAGGTDLALMCDRVVAADDARIAFPATRANGTPPNHMWVYHVGPQWAHQQHRIRRIRCRARTTAGVRCEQARARWADQVYCRVSGSAWRHL